MNVRGEKFLRPAGVTWVTCLRLELVRVLRLNARRAIQRSWDEQIAAGHRVLRLPAGTYRVKRGSLRVPTVSTR